MTAYEGYVAGQTLLRARFERIARNGQFDAILPKPRVGLVLVGGPRNKSGKIAAGPRLGLEAAFRSILRNERHLQDQLREVGR